MSYVCRFCYSSNTDLLFNRPGTYFWHGPDSEYFRNNLHPIKLEAEIMLCADCGFIGLPVNETLRRILELYYTSPSSMPGTTQGKDNVFAVARTEEFFKAISDLGQTETPESILEIGCQRGFLLHEFMKRGSKKVVGIEPGEVEPWKEKYDQFEIEIRRGFLSDKNISEKEFDFVFSLQVFEHVDTPNEFLSMIHKALRPGGKLMLAVPNEYHAMRAGNLGMFVFQHVNLFTPKGIELLLSANGFRTVKVISKWDRPLYILAEKDKKKPIIHSKALVEDHRSMLNNYARKVNAILEGIEKSTSGKNKNDMGLWGCNAAMANIFSWKPELANKYCRIYDTDPSKIGKSFGGVPGVVRGPDEADNLKEIYVVPYMASEKIKQFLWDLLGAGVKCQSIYDFAPPDTC